MIARPSRPHLRHLALALALGSGCTRSPPPVDADRFPRHVENCSTSGRYGPHLREGLRYGPASHMELDLALPSGSGPFPWVVVLHGGGWTQGHRSHVRHDIRMMAGRGVAAAAVSYRLASAQAPSFPGAVSDIRCAVRFLRREAEALGLAPERGALIGYSAGGHLALLSGLGWNSTELDDSSCSDSAGVPRPDGIVAFFPPVDLRDRARFGEYANEVISAHLGREDRSAATRASPITHIDGADPPVVVLHGQADRVVPIEQSRHLASALRRADVASRLIELPREGHSFLLFSREPAHRVARCSALAFLDEVLGVTRH